LEAGSWNLPAVRHGMEDGIWELEAGSGKMGEGR